MDVKKTVMAHVQSMVTDRRWLHQHAETAWKENETTTYIETRLKELGLTPQRFPCGTGCWAFIEGTHPDQTGKTILLRADIDAMPGTDRKDVPYRSIHEGAVHSCGHDGHTAMLLAAAQVFQEHRDQLKGRVKLVFEPAEELSVGGQYCVSQGALEGVDAAFGIHVWDALDEGTVDITEGPCMAGFHGFSVTIHGLSNTCIPWAGADAIQAAAKVIENLQLIHTSFVNPFTEPTTLTLGTLHGGMARNTFCDHVVLEGVIRTFYHGSNEELRAFIQRVAQGAAQLNGCIAEVVVEDGLEPVNHDSKAMNLLVQNAAKTVLGENSLRTLGPNLGGDTFASYNSKVPGFYARLGVHKPALPAQVQYAPHDDRFTFDDEVVVPDGAALFVQVVLDFFDSADF